MIPKILHQTYSNSDIPQSCRGFIQVLKDIHPTWQYEFYSDEDCRRIIRQEYPELLPIYTKCPLPVMRADIFRIVIVYLRGGFYLDLDMDFAMPLDDLVSYNAVFATENILSENEAQRFNHGDTLRIANYAFGASAFHPFLEFLIKEMLMRYNGPFSINTELDVLETTGPGFLSRCYHEYFANKQSDNVALLPLTGEKCGRCGGWSCQFGKYAMHRHMGTWRWHS